MKLLRALLPILLPGLLLGCSGGGGSGSSTPPTTPTPPTPPPPPAANVGPAIVADTQVTGPLGSTVQVFAQAEDPDHPNVNWRWLRGTTTAQQGSLGVPGADPQPLPALEVTAEATPVTYTLEVTDGFRTAQTTVEVSGISGGITAADLGVTSTGAPLATLQVTQTTGGDWIATVEAAGLRLGAGSRTWRGRRYPGFAEATIERLELYVDQTRVDQATVNPAAAETRQQWTLPAGTTPDGPHVVTAVVYRGDPSQSVARLVPAAWFLDRQAPAVTVDAPTPGQVFPSERFLVRGTASDATSGVQSLTVDGVPARPTQAGFATWEADVTATVTSGAVTIPVIARDGAGLETQTSVTVTIDPAGAAPSAAVSLETADGTRNPTSSGDVLDWGAHPLDLVSRCTRRLRVENTGNVPLDLQTPLLSGPDASSFRLDGSLGRLYPGEVQSVVLGFAPRAPETTKSAQLDLGLDRAAPGALTLDLRGQGAGLFSGAVRARAPDAPDPNDPSGVLGLAVADLDGDGALDLLSCDPFQDTVLWARGRGDGTWDLPVSWPVGDAPREVFAGDLDGDGRLDLLTLNRTSQDLSVLLQTSPGVLTPQPRPATGAEPLAACAGDFDRDGHLDLAVTHASGSRAILLGDGAGGFAVSNPSPLGTWLPSLVTADLGRDGVLDLVSADRGDPDPNATDLGQIWIELGRGDGTFDPPQAIAIERPIEVRVADLDRDGRLDLVALDAALTVRVLLAQPSGGFAQTQSFTVGDAEDLALADVDGDGWVDLLVGRRISGNQFLYVGGPQGLTFLRQVDLADTDTEFRTGRVAWGDVDGDGAPDPLAGGTRWIGGARTRLAHPTWRFVGETIANLGGVDGAAWGDVDQDGALDVIWSYGPVVWSRNARPGWEASRDVGVSGTVFEVGDLDRDGAPDVLLGEASSLRRVGLVVPGAETFPLTTTPLASRWVDGDRDGWLDLVAAFGASSDRVRLEHTPPGQFATPSAAPRRGHALATGHDRAGAWVALSGDEVWIEGRTPAGDTLTGPLFAGRTPGALDLGDLDGDGLLDLAVAVQDGIQWVLQDPAGGWRAPSLVTLGFRPEVIAIADVDRDGVPELLAGWDDVAGGVLAWFQEGGSGWVEVGRSTLSTGPRGIRLADADADGWADALIWGPDGLEVVYARCAE